MQITRQRLSPIYTQGIFWNFSILPIVILGRDDAFRIEHSGKLIKGCFGRADSDWNWKTGFIEPFESSEPIQGQGGFLMGIRRTDLIKLTDALHAIQRDDVVDALMRYLPIESPKVRAHVGTRTDLELRQAELIQLLLGACVVGAEGPCPHRLMIAQHALDARQPTSSLEKVWAVLYRLCELSKRNLNAREFFHSMEMSQAFEAGARSWSEPVRSPAEEAACLAQAEKRLKELWLDLVRLSS
ncbi:MAG: hypothetical protein ABIO72_02995 [Patescibacteria group bacterium]